MILLVRLTPRKNLVSMLCDVCVLWTRQGNKRDTRRGKRAWKGRGGETRKSKTTTKCTRGGKRRRHKRGRAGDMQDKTNLDDAVEEREDRESRPGKRRKCKSGREENHTTHTKEMEEALQNCLQGQSEPPPKRRHHVRSIIRIAILQLVEDTRVNFYHGVREEHGNRRSWFIDIISKEMPVSGAMYKMYHNSYNLPIEAVFLSNSFLFQLYSSLSSCGDDSPATSFAHCISSDRFINHTSI